MTAWILGIVGVVVFGVVLDLLLKEGEMQRFIKSIFALISVFVIIAPIPKLINSDYSFNLFSGSEINVDSSYLSALYRAQVTALEKEVESDLFSIGWEGVRVEINVSSYSESMAITRVVLNTKNLVINNQLQHIFSYEEVQERVASKLLIDRSLVIRQ